jgi:hypothetical protein
MGIDRKVPIMQTARAVALLGMLPRGTDSDRSVAELQVLYACRVPTTSTTPCKSS